MIKKVSAAMTALSAYAVYATSALAQGVKVQIEPPQSGINPAVGASTVFSNALTIIFIVAALAVLFMLIIGAFNWITSGGDKDKVGGAQKRITQALAGLVVLALAFLIVTVVGRIVNINILDINAIPTLDACPGGKIFDTTLEKCVERGIPTATPTGSPLL